MSTTHDTDVAIIGAGPVGLFAVFECGMLNIACHVLDTLAVAGGQCAALYPEKPIYDIPGYPKILAQELVDRLLEQAAPFRPVYHLGEQVVRLGEAGERLIVENSAGTRVRARAVIIAAGGGAFGPNRPPLAGIEQHEGKPEGEGVHYRVGHPEAYRGRNVVIAGGGDSAVDWALALAGVAKSIAVVHRRTKFRAAPESARKLAELAEAGAVQLVIPYQLHAVEGTDGRLTAVIVRSLDGRQEQRLPADALLAFFGLSRSLGPIVDWGLTLDAHGHHIVVDPARCSTNRPGVFAIGDIVTYPGKLKLILTGFSEAAVAAHAIFPLVHPGEALHFEYSTSKGLPATD